jgi:hypothetical protein
MISELIAALSENTVNFTAVSHAWTIDPVDNLSEKMPILFVFAGDDDFGEDGTDGLIAKMATQTIHIYIVCEIADLDARKSELRGAAIGWSAGENYTDLAPISGKVIAIKGSVVWWDEIYANRVKISEL